MAKIRVGDIGTVVELTIADQDGIVDLTGATTKDFRFENALKTTFVKASTFVTDGTDGKLKYAFIASDLDVAGSWKVQAEIVLPSGTWTSGALSFSVYSREIQ